MVHMVYKKTELKHAEYKILNAMADLLLTHSAMQEVVDRPMEYSGMKMEKMYELVISFFSGEEALGLRGIALSATLSSMML